MLGTAVPAVGTQQLRPIVLKGCQNSYVQLPSTPYERACSRSDVSTATLSHSRPARNCPRAQVAAHAEYTASSSARWYTTSGWDTRSGANSGSTAGFSGGPFGSTGRWQPFPCSASTGGRPSTCGPAAHARDRVPCSTSAASACASSSSSSCRSAGGGTCSSGSSSSSCGRRAVLSGISVSGRSACWSRAPGGSLGRGVMQAACQRGHQPLRTTLCQATQQQREEAAEAQLQEIAEQQATAEAAAEVPAAEDEEGAAAPPVRVKGGASNMGTGTKYALMSTLEENESIDAIEELQILEPMVEERGEFVFLLVGAALLFGAGIWAVEGPDKGAEYFAGYLLEQSLSVDNLFVFILVFKYLQVPREDQPKVLTYGILSAAVLRGIMIGLGAELLENFKAVLLVFAGVLLYSSWQLLAVSEDDEEEDLTDNWIVNTCKRFIKVSDTYDGENFFTEQNGVRMATPLLLALAVIEVSDVVFAVDSVPAVFGVTQDPFIVYTSNMWAILSLRALYGFVSTIMGELRFLNKAVALVLGFVGAKMVGQFGGLEISTQASLAVVAGVLGGGVGLSLLLPALADSAAEK